MSPFRKREIGEEEETVFWAVFYIAKFREDENEYFMKRLKKALKPYKPSSVTFNELNTFLAMRASIPPQTSPKPEEEEKIKELEARIGEAANAYAQKVMKKYDKELRKDPEIIETIRIFNNLLEQNPEYIGLFNQQAQEIIKNIEIEYGTVLQVARIHIWDFPGLEYDYAVVAGVRIEFSAALPDYEHLIDETVLFSFSRRYQPPTKKFLDEIQNAISQAMKVFKIYSEETDPKKQIMWNQPFFEAVQMILGKTEGTYELMQKIKRQTLRMTGIAQTLIKELKEEEATDVIKIVKQFDITPELEDLAKQTETMTKELQETAKTARKISTQMKTAEKEDRAAPLITPEIEELGHTMGKLYLELETLRLWADNWDDIPYYTAAPGAVAFEQETLAEEELKALARQIPEDAVIHGENIFKTYRMGRNTIYALRGVNITIKEGEFVALVGPSGCGKTTLLNVLSGLDTPDRGRIYLKGDNIATLADKELTKTRRDDIGFVFQTYNLIPELTTLENVMLPAQMSGKPGGKTKQKALQILEDVGIQEFANQYPEKLSGGQQQRVTIARALINDPSIIVGDEPTGDLDSGTGQAVMDIFKKINKERGVTILMVTHDPKMAKQAGRLLEMRDGQIISDIW